MNKICSIVFNSYQPASCHGSFQQWSICDTIDVGLCPLTDCTMPWLMLVALRFGTKRLTFNQSCKWLGFFCQCKTNNGGIDHQQFAKSSDCVSRGNNAYPFSAIIHQNMLRPLLKHCFPLFCSWWIWLSLLGNLCCKNWNYKLLVRNWIQFGRP